MICLNHLPPAFLVPPTDLELVLPEKRVFVPPTVLLQLAITLVLGLVAVWGALKQVQTVLV